MASLNDIWRIIKEAPEHFENIYNSVVSLSNVADVIDGIVDNIKLKTDTINWANITTIVGDTSNLLTNLGIVDGVVDLIKLATDTISWADIGTLLTNVGSVLTNLAIVDGIVDTINTTTAALPGIATIESSINTLIPTLIDNKFLNATWLSSMTGAIWGQVKAKITVAEIKNILEDISQAIIEKIPDILNNVFTTTHYSNIEDAFHDWIYAWLQTLTGAWSLT